MIVNYDRNLLMEQYKTDLQWNRHSFLLWFEKSIKQKGIKHNLSVHL